MQQYTLVSYVSIQIETILDINARIILTHGVRVYDLLAFRTYYAAQYHAGLDWI